MFEVESYMEYQASKQGLLIPIQEQRTVAAAEASASSGASSGSDVKTLIQRLPPAELRRLSEGYRRICRADAAPSPSSASSSTPVPLPPPPPPVAAPSARNSSAGVLPSVVPAALKRRASGIATAPTPAANANAHPTAALSKKVFRQKVLSAFAMIPTSLADRLFDVLDTERSGELSCDNLLSGVARLKYGTYEEQVRLLFVLYDLDSVGLVTRDVMDRFMDVVYGRRHARSATTIAFLDRIFDSRSGLTIDEFKLVIRERDERGDPLLLRWLSVLADAIGAEEDPQILALERSYNPAMVRQRIADDTLFSVNEVSMLERQFHKLFDTKGGASNRIPREQFVRVLGERGFPPRLLERVGDATALSDLVLFDEFCSFVSKFCRGRTEARSVHLFELFKYTSAAAAGALKDAIPWSALQELLALGRDCAPLESERALIETEEHILAEMMNASRGDSLAGLRETQFLEWASESTAVRQLLHQLAFAACILFGMKPESPHLERRIVEWHWKQAAVSFSVGETWNLVGAKWWQQWCVYSGMDPRNGTPSGSLPLPIVPDDARVVVENVDPKMVPSAVYAVLVLWYSGGPDLSRSIIAFPKARLQIELFPLVLRVARVDPSNGGVIMSGEEVLLSSLSTADSILEATCKALLLQKLIQKTRLWYFDERQPGHKIRIRSDRPAILKRLTQDCVFLLEVQDDDGSWPLSQSSDTITSSPSNKSPKAQDADEYSSSDSDDGDDADGSTRQGGGTRKRPREPRMSRTSEICSRGNLETLTTLGGVYKNGKSESVAAPNASDEKKKGAKASPEHESLAVATTVKKRFSKDAFTGHGLVGLDNLGNTCYMSSALQCLSHTRLLVEYFKNEAYLKDINLRNRDGTNGKLAVAFGELLRVLWTSEKKRFAPNEFKRVLARCNPQFTGSDQHDAQELLACLLSSLSEDLNRIMTKPYTEQPDSNGRSDAIVANEWWLNHLKRELSVIVALFTGQYKSLLECSVCHYESARFEPFTFLQLSLPESSYRSVVLTIIFNSGRVPMKYSVRAKNNATIQDVKHDVAQFLHQLERQAHSEAAAATASTLRQIEAQLVIARVSPLHTVETLLDSRTPLAQVHEKDQLSAFQLDAVPAPRSSGTKTTAPERAPEVLVARAAEPPANGNGKHAFHEAAAGGDIVKEKPDTATSEAHANGVSISAEAAAQENDAASDEILAVGTSVYVRADKAKEFAPARVIGSNAASGTVDVAFPTGGRRYAVSEARVVARQSDDAFVYLVHRRIERSTSNFANAHISRLFGAPLVLRVSLSATTTFDLYLSVWKRLRRIFNWQEPPSPSAFAATAARPRASDDASTRVQTDASALALGSHLPVTQFGFCLRLVTASGGGCSRCEWLDGCLGCLILPSPQRALEVTAEETIAIDWDIRTLKEEYDPIQASKLDVDASVQANKRQDNMPLSIERCMDMFTAKERIQEAYCGRCRTHRPATKTMDLWRLPPLLVIQLKRFCYTQVSRRKLHHHVDFPLRGLQLEAFVAKQRQPKRMQESGLHYWLFLGGKLAQDSDDADGEQEPGSETGSGGDGGDGGDSKEAGANDADSNGSDGTTSPTRSVSMPLLDAPATATVRGEDGFLYDLYAVVNHVGALGGGHYFAYVLSQQDGKWKCFNDHQCKDIDEKEVVSSTAYILFYRRRDTENLSIEEVFPPMPLRPPSGTGAGAGGDESADQAQVEQMMEQSKLASAGGSTCVIS
ncbi:hypothetical protein PybrP1_009211 [[Pythium] brassicae (nom. inval.)]|nr:hypothetical protein PybrP1_009211 [[Pythium] brassicae (nom. inval.)]